MHRLFKWFVIGTLFLSVLACSSSADITNTPVPADNTAAQADAATPSGNSANTPAATAVKSTQAPKPTNTATAPKLTLGKIGDKVETGGLAITVVKVQKATSFNSFMTADDGNTYVDIEVVIENTGRDEIPYNPYYFKLKDADKYEYTTAFGSLDPSLQSGDLKKGDVVRGHVAFEVPEKATGLVVSYEPMVLFGGYETLSVDLEKTSDKPAVLNTAAAPTLDGKVGEKVESAGVAMIVVKTEKVKKAGYLTPKAGNIIIDIEVIIQNASRDETTPYNTMYFKVKDGSGYEYDPSFGSIEPSLRSGDLVKGDMARGHLAVEVPEIAAGLVLSYEPMVIFGNYKTIRIDLDTKTDKPADLPKAITYDAYKVGTPVESAGIAITIEKIQKLKTIGYSTASAGNILIDVDVLIQNTSRTEATPYNPMYFVVKDANGYEYGEAMSSLDPSLKSGDLNKGDQARGHVAFEVPADATNLVLSYEPIVLFGDYQPIHMTLVQ